MKVKASIKVYWMIMAVFIALQMIALLAERDSLLIAFMFILAAAMVIGSVIETERFTGYYKRHYPTEYKEMLKRGRFKDQFEFSPSGDDVLKILQRRFKNYFIYIVCVFLSVLLMGFIRLVY
jgi:5'(3')-deoxyribonucleotidase